MIILDTNVLSELMRPNPAPPVLAWVADRPASSLYVTSVTQAEVLFGLELMPRGKRRDGMAEAARGLFEQDFAGRVLNFSSDAAQYYAVITAARQRAGRPIATLDAQIAAIARLRGAGIATRNVTDFVDCGIGVLNPWT